LSILSSAICEQVLKMTSFQLYSLLWMGGRQRSSPTRPAILKRTIMSFDEAIFQAVVGMLFQIFLSCANNPDRRQQGILAVWHKPFHLLTETAKARPKANAQRTRVVQHVHKQCFTRRAASTGGHWGGTTCRMNPAVLAFYFVLACGLVAFSRA
jgi:hypothetical protein